MKCQFPECSIAATKPWALLPLCDKHHELIRAETSKYYNGLGEKIEVAQRPNYYKIDLKIAHSKRSLKLKRGEKI